MDTIVIFFQNAYKILIESSLFMILGLTIGGLLKVFLRPDFIIHHLGNGRFSSVFKAALLGIPLPLCSCSVLPAASSLKKQGASNGAVTAFLISTPETGVDSISVTYALLDPIMTVARPVSAFITALTAGIIETFFSRNEKKDILQQEANLICPIDGCCNGIDCPPHTHKHHHSFFQKIKASLYYAFFDLWADIAVWFFVGIAISSVVMTLIPDDFLSNYFGGNLSGMILTLIVGMLVYICATGSTPVAAAMILKGVSPGTALVFLLAGPATNLTTMIVLIKLIGKRGLAIYLSSIAVMTILCGLSVDYIYSFFKISPKALMGHHHITNNYEALQITGLIIILIFSIPPFFELLKRKFSREKKPSCCSHTHS